MVSSRKQRPQDPRGLWLLVMETVPGWSLTPPRTTGSLPANSSPAPSLPLHLAVNG